MTGRRSRWFSSESKLWVSSLQTRLLYEDFHNKVVPYRHHPEPYELFTEGVSGHQVDESLSLGDAWQLDGFLRAVASRLLTHHEVWLEVAFENESRDQTPFGVSEVDGVRRTETGTLIQELPSRDELPDWHRGGDDWELEVELDAGRMVYVSLPDAYSSQLLMQVVRDLAEVDPSVTPDWAMERWAGQRQDSPRFDVSEAIRMQRLRIAHAALPIGWTARETFFGPNSQSSDYYHYWRELRFLHFLSSMRVQAEEALRQVLGLAGRRCGFVASVIAHGVYTPDEVQGFIRKFEAGELAFSAVNELIFENVKDAEPEGRRVV